MRGRVVVLAVMALTGAALFVTAVTASPRSRADVTAPAWTLAFHGGAASDGRYTLLTGVNLRGAPIILDEQTGERDAVRLRRGCRVLAGSVLLLGHGWLLANCSAARIDLFSLATHRWRSVRVPLACQRADEGCVPADVGVDWIAYDVEEVRQGDVLLFQNIATGQVRSDPTGPHTLPDLDAPTLARSVCAPLRVPPHGSLRLDGGFAVASLTARVVLERCGSSLHLTLTGGQPVSAAPGALLWLLAPTGRLQGITLPGLRRFTLSPPHDAGQVVAIAIGLRHIYLIGEGRDGTPDVWSAPIGTIAAATGT